MDHFLQNIMLEGKVAETETISKVVVFEAGLSARFPQV